MTRHVGWGTGVALAYAAFACATLAVVAFAMGQHVDLVSDDYYARSLDHDRHIEAVENAGRLGTSFRCDVAADGRSVIVRWPPDEIATAKGLATFYRPSDAAGDRTIELSPGPDGSQRLSLAALPHGSWRLELDWSATGRRYYIERVLVIR